MCIRDSLCLANPLFDDGVLGNSSVILLVLDDVLVFRIHLAIPCDRDVTVDLETLLYLMLNQQPADYLENQSNVLASFHSHVDVVALNRKIQLA